MHETEQKDKYVQQAAFGPELTQPLAESYKFSTRRTKMVRSMRDV